jgi:hypothetical protein
MSNDDTEDTMDRRPNTRRGLLRAGVGGVAAALTLPTISGNAAAHFPDEIDLVVSPSREFMDNRKLGHAHTIDAESDRVAVWVLPNEAFDPLSNAANYRFGTPSVVDEGDGGRPAASYVGMDYADERLLLVFSMEGAGFEGDECEAKLAWERHHGGSHGLSGTAPIRVKNGELVMADDEACEANHGDEGADDHGEGGSAETGDEA